MRNPFDRLSELSVDRPKTAIAVAVIGILALSSFAQFIVFDNSEDAFYPENETTDLLYEVEDTYTVDIDLIRAIVRFDSGDLQTCLLYTSPSPRDRTRSRMPSSA